LHLHLHLQGKAITLALPAVSNLSIETLAMLNKPG
jgi:hypothetical protein